MDNVYNFNEFLAEKKKINDEYQAFLEKKANKKKDADADCEKKEEKEDKKEEKEEEEEEPKKGLTAKQKKLPEGLQKAILKRQGK
jgi:hypothetical protein